MELFRNLGSSSLRGQSPSGNLEQGKSENSLILFRNFYRDIPLGTILYKDQTVLRKVYDHVIATTLYREQLRNHLRNSESQNLYEQLSSLNWHEKQDTNFDYLVLILASIITKKGSVAELADIILKSPTQNKMVDHIIYPTQPLCLIGHLSFSKDADDIMVLGFEGVSINAYLHIPHKLSKYAPFLADEFIFVIGYVDIVEGDIAVTTGAVLI